MVRSGNKAASGVTVAPVPSSPPQMQRLSRSAWTTCSPKAVRITKGRRSLTRGQFRKLGRHGARPANARPARRRAWPARRGAARGPRRASVRASRARARPGGRSPPRHSGGFLRRAARTRSIRCSACSWGHLLVCAGQCSHPLVRHPPIERLGEPQPPLLPADDTVQMVQAIGIIHDQAEVARIVSGEKVPAELRQLGHVQVPAQTERLADGIGVTRRTAAVLWRTSAVAANAPRDQPARIDRGRGSTRTSCSHQSPKS